MNVIPNSASKNEDKYFSPRTTIRHRVRMLRHWTERFRGNLTASANPNPIIIFGNQKSGTSAIASLLGLATGRSVLIDLFFRFGSQSLPVLYGERSLDRLLEKSPAYTSYDIIKEPEFILFYDELRKRFPHSKMVFVVRDPISNIRSILNRIGIPGNLPHLDCRDIEPFLSDHPLWLPVIEGPREDLRAGNYIEVLAKRWNHSASVYLESRSQIILAKYEDFQCGKRFFIEDLANSLGLEVVSDVSSFVNKPYQKPGKKADPLEFFGEQNFYKIVHMCRESALQFGYTIDGMKTGPG